MKPFVNLGRGGFADAVHGFQVAPSGFGHRLGRAVEHAFGIDLVADGMQDIGVQALAISGAGQRRVALPVQGDVAADAAGADAIIVPRHGAAGLGPTVSKVATGAAEHLPYAAVANLCRVLDWLGEYGVTRVATSDKADKSLYEVDLSGPMVLVMGREHSGVDEVIERRCDALVSLPMLGSVSSLNVSVATGICLYEARRQRA